MTPDFDFETLIGEPTPSGYTVMDYRVNNLIARYSYLFVADPVVDVSVLDPVRIAEKLSQEPLGSVADELQEGLKLDSSGS